MEVVKAEIVNEVFVRIDCSDHVAYELRDAFSFQIPGFQFMPAFKMKRWDGKINLFSPATRQIYRGLIDQVKKFCKDSGYQFIFADDDLKAVTVDQAETFIDLIKPKHRPRDYQFNAFLHSIYVRRALLLSPTASGKSLIIYLLIRYFLSIAECKKILIIVPTISLVEQLYSDFEDYSATNSWSTDLSVHRIYQGKDRVTSKPVIVSTWQSLSTMPSKYFKQFDAVIGDEAHLFRAKSLTQIMCALTNARFRIGTTGTLDGSKTNKLVLEGMFGPVTQVTTTRELIDKKTLADLNIKCLLLKHPDDQCLAARKYTYQQELDYLIGNQRRNEFIAKLAIFLSGNTLVLYQYVEKHGRLLYTLITDYAQAGRKVFFVHGDTDAEVREEIRKIVNAEQNAIIVASYGTFSTGVNVPNLHNVIFASPSKSRIRNLQSIGRSLRTSNSKTEATLYDIADNLSHRKRENFTLKHFFERIKLYAEEKFIFKIFKIDLEQGDVSAHQHR